MNILKKKSEGIVDENFDFNCFLNQKSYALNKLIFALQQTEHFIVGIRKILSSPKIYISGSKHFEFELSYQGRDDGTGKREFVNCLNDQEKKALLLLLQSFLDDVQERIRQECLYIQNEVIEKL